MNTDRYISRYWTMSNRSSRITTGCSPRNSYRVEKECPNSPAKSWVRRNDILSAVYRAPSPLTDAVFTTAISGGRAGARPVSRRFMSVGFYSFLMQRPNALGPLEKKKKKKGKSRRKKKKHGRDGKSTRVLQIRPKNSVQHECAYYAPFARSLSNE